MTARHVYKYQIPVAEKPSELVMPAGAVIVTVGTQQPGMVTLWAESADQPTAAAAARMFVTVPTGVDVHDDTARYVGTAHDGEYVWHLYEIPTETL